MKDKRLLNGAGPAPKETVRQPNPEFTQTSYLRMRSIEEAYPM
jgi:hypothetical protein